MRSNRRSIVSTLLAAVLATVAVAAVAIAATPESGTLSAATPEVKWSGQAGPYPGGALYGDDGAGPDCEAPNCDVFTLNVADGPADITFTLTATNYGNVEFDVTKPDGETVYETSDVNEPTRKLTIKGAVNGVYKVNTWPYGIGLEPMKYTGKVTRAGAAPAGTAGPVGTATPAPAARPTLKITTGRQSARKVRKAMTVSVTASSRVTDVLATLKKGSKVLGSARLASLEGTKKMKLKLKKKIKKGSYTVLVQAGDGQGGKVMATAKVKVAR